MRFSCNRCAIRVLLLATMVLSLFGCGGGGGSTTAPAVTSISGKVSLGGAGQSGVAIAITGAASNSLTTDANGSFSVSGVPNGNYTITPSLAGFTFFPASKTITVANGSVTGTDFTATAVSASFTVSGKVTLGGAALSGITVTIAGAGTGNTTTDASGNYTFTGVHNGNCTITPSSAAFTFTPLSKNVTVANANVTGQDFTATPATAVSFTITGKVSLNGTGLQGVTVDIAGTGFGSLTTDASGNYTFTGVQNGNYTITPSLTGYTFTPANSAFSVNGANVSGQDFTAAPAGTGSIIFTF